MSEIIKSVSDAIDSVHYSGFDKGQIIFRGQVSNDISWKLQPTLFRRFEERPEFASMFEVASLEVLLQGNKSPYANSFDPIEHLICLQHFEVPTRLLDWTSDILIALFFACYDASEKYGEHDGRLFLVDRQPYEQFNINGGELKIFKSKPTIELHESMGSRLQNSTISYFEPLLKNPKMRVQDGCFLFYPYGSFNTKSPFLDLISFNKEFDKHVDSVNQKNQTNLAKSFLVQKDIAADSKKSILRELRLKYGISKESVFVEIENIETATTWHKEHYNYTMKKAERLFNLKSSE